MSRFLTYSEILSGKAPKFGEAVVKGSSLTIPGQGSDLAQIISSIVKLPPLDERSFDIPAGSDPDIQTLAMQVELDSMYLSEGKNLAEDASARQKGRKEAKKAAEKEKADKGTEENADAE